MLFWWFCHEVEKNPCDFCSKHPRLLHKCNVLQKKKISHSLAKHSPLPVCKGFSLVSVTAWGAHCLLRLPDSRTLMCFFNATSLIHYGKCFSGYISEEKLSAFLFVPQQQRNGEKKNPKTKIYCHKADSEIYLSIT